jgi:membrane-associated phospholipid phosphatase
MTKPPEVPTTLLVEQAPTTNSLAFAKLLSAIFNPLVVNIATFIVVGLYGFERITDGLTWASICILSQAFPVLIYYAIGRQRGRFTDGDISVRSQRHELYLFSLVMIIAGAIILPFFGLPQPFLALLIAATIIGVVNGVVNLFWKISAHSTSLSTLASVALVYSFWLGVTLWVCTAVVGWARLKTRNHTLGQVVAGCAVAAVAVTGVFELML